MTHYLLVKTHLKTGLQYLCKTTRNPFKYDGSGFYWKRHLKIHGEDVGTHIVRECKDNNELKEWGIYYSNLWNVVESDLWANLKPEAGDGGGYVAGSESAKQVSLKMKGHPNWAPPHTREVKNKISKVQTDLLSKMTPEELSARMKNSCCHPDSYTEERSNNISKSLTGRTIGENQKKNIAIGSSRHRKSLGQEQRNVKYGKQNSGKTWKLVDGKRVWLDREN